MKLKRPRTLGKGPMLKSRFTLMELLVVVAVIAILASLLLPSLGKARKKAKLVVCKSNMKQIGLASQMYSDDNEQYVVWSIGSISWDDLLGKGYDGRNITDQAMYDKKKLAEAPIYQCASSDFDVEKKNTLKKRSYNLNLGQGSTTKKRGASGVKFSMKSTFIKEPSESILISEYNIKKNYLGNTDNDFMWNARLISYGFYNKPNDRLWTHKYAKLNFGMHDGSTHYLSLQQTMMGVGEASSTSDVVGTMWDCRK